MFKDAVVVVVAVAAVAVVVVILFFPYFYVSQRRGEGREVRGLPWRRS